MMNDKCGFLLLVFLLSTRATVLGQAAAPDAPKSEPDVLVLVDGEKLIGHLESASATSLLFKSDLAGEVTIDWSKVQELRSAEKFAVIPKGAKLRRSEDASKVPQGTVSVADQKVEVSATPSAAPQTIPVPDVTQVIPEPDFERAFRGTSFAHGWIGGATAGISLTESTQSNQTFSGAVNLVRTVPGESWLDNRSRTIFDFNEAYSKLSQPGTPDIKTSLFHSDLEQDWYLSPRFFLMAQAMFDHNVSQDLDLQQTYGGGFGWVLVKRADQEFDFKASADYIDQRFGQTRLDQTLVGSIFGETYMHKFLRNIHFNEQGGVTPAWNNTNAYSAFANVGLTFPVYHRLGITLGSSDNYLNDPPKNFKKNSFEFTLGATYSFPKAP
jgi:hypothetical protein